MFAATGSSLREALAKQSSHSLYLVKSARALPAETGAASHPLQFRANRYGEPGSGQPMERQRWTDGRLQIGKQVLLGATPRDTRRRMIHLDPQTGRQNPAVLKAVAPSHQRQIDHYGTILRPGQIRVVDALGLIPSPHEPAANTSARAAVRPVYALARSFLNK